MSSTLSGKVGYSDSASVTASGNTIAMMKVSQTMVPHLQRRVEGLYELGLAVGVDAKAAVEDAREAGELR